MDLPTPEWVLRELLTVAFGQGNPLIGIVAIVSFLAGWYSIYARLVTVSTAVTQDIKDSSAGRKGVLVLALASQACYVASSAGIAAWAAHPRGDLFPPTPDWVRDDASPTTANAIFWTVFLVSSLLMCLGSWGIMWLAEALAMMSGWAIAITLALAISLAGSQVFSAPGFLWFLWPLLHFGSGMGSVCWAEEFLDG